MQTLPMSFTGSCPEDEPNFPWQENDLTVQKIVAGIDKVVTYKDF